MAKHKKVSSRTHTRQQLNDYANQNNPTSKAYKARIANEKKMRNQKNVDIGSFDLDWSCYSKGPYEFD